MKTRKEVLYHHGISGQKWGKRNGPPYPLEKGKTDKPKKNHSIKDQVLGSDNEKNIKKKKDDDSESEVKEQKKSISDMSDDELRRRISRLDMEVRYQRLLKEMAPQTRKGSRFVMDILEKAGKSTLTKLAEYEMGVGVNKMLGKEVINVKSGKKEDKD